MLAWYDEPVVRGNRIAVVDGECLLGFENERFVGEDAERAKHFQRIDSVMRSTIIG